MEKLVLKERDKGFVVEKENGMWIIDASLLFDQGYLIIDMNEFLKPREEYNQDRVRFSLKKRKRKKKTFRELYYGYVIKVSGYYITAQGTTATKRLAKPFTREGAINYINENQLQSAIIENAW